MIRTQSIKDLIREGGGLVTTKQVVAAGIPRARLTDMVRSGELERVYRGVYCLADEWEDEFLASQLRFPKGTLSHGTALYLHGLTDRTPFAVAMTFPRSYNATKAREAGIEVRTCSDAALRIGAATIKTPCGNEVRTYDVERTLCDLVRGRATVDVQVVTPAMRMYVAGSGRDVQKLIGYARALGVEGKIRRYLEVPL